ncbi:DUF6732 family protein [Sinisalibacter aestuarii]|uniref:Uncharacterized protein n=1 Tax=Sinisalibacter aestuarii TaxID=2949426 RepID=A0ABQ5LVQ3_9RHOB|nr:DUF6732 family protein [Sinisalibacter aestuarii]GKY88858.1 hypothetical protein STA1M1_27270 [Sinisalibacter aestuarii]
MRALLTLMLMLLPGLAFAHPGHLIEVAGHDHLIAGVAIGVAIGVAVWGALKGRPTADKARDTDAEEADEDELQEA